MQSLNTHLIPSNEQSSRFSVWVDCGRGYSNRVESSKSQLIFRQWPLLNSVERVEKVRKGCTETDIEGSSTTARFVIPFCFIVFSKISHSRIQPRMASRGMLPLAPASPLQFCANHTAPHLVAGSTVLISVGVGTYSASMFGNIDHCENPRGLYFSLPMMLYPIPAAGCPVLA